MKVRSRFPNPLTEEFKLFRRITQWLITQKRKLTITQNPASKTEREEMVDDFDQGDENLNFLVGKMTILGPLSPPPFLASCLQDLYTSAIK